MKTLGSIVKDSDRDLFCISVDDTAYDAAAPVLAYGQRTRLGPMACDSEQAGVTCTLETSGHGFFVSRDSYRLF